MHKHVIVNQCHQRFADFSAAILTFLREEAPQSSALYCDHMSDNSCIASPKGFQILV